MARQRRAGKSARASQASALSTRKAQLPLERHESRFRAIFESAAIGIAVVDPAGRPLQCNPALERFLGYSEPELQMLTFPQVTHPDDISADVALYNRLIAGEFDHYQLEKRYLRKDGKIVWARLTVSLILVGPEEQRFVVAMVEDIDAQKATQVALVESEEKFLKSFHGNPNPGVITRIADGRILEANQAFREWFGVTEIEAQSRTTFDLGIWPAARDREKLLSDLKRAGAIRNHELNVTLPSGEEKTVLLAVQSIQLHGVDCLLTTTTDITSQKQAERALRLSEEKLRLGLQAARMGTWEWEVARNAITWSPEVDRMFGLPPDRFAGRFEAFLDLVWPEDRERAEFEVRRALEHPAFPYYTVIRTRWPDGSLHWIEARGEVQTDANGIGTALLGTMVDVTERKELEASLRAAQDRELEAREEFTRLLLAAVEQERQSLAAELHDSIGQNLSLITNQAHFALADITLPAEVRHRLEAITAFTSGAIAELRNLVRNLRPIEIERLGLTDSVKDLIERTFASSGIEVRSRIENVDDAVKGSAATHLYRIIQEGIGNVIKHARATTVAVELERDIRCVRLRVSDNGKGFEPAIARRKGGLGLTSISERAAMLGGETRFQSRPGQGSTLALEIPIPELEKQTDASTI